MKKNETGPHADPEYPGRSRPRGETHRVVSGSESGCSRHSPSIGARLLEYLRERLEVPALAYHTQPERFASGVENRVFALHLDGAPRPFDRPLVLRLYGEHARPSRARLEAALQNAVADEGYAAPRVLHVCEDPAVLGGAFILMERLSGHVFLEPFSRPGTGFFAPMIHWRSLLFRMPRLLAELMTSLHALDAEAVLRRVRAAGADADDLRFDARFRGIEQRVDEAGLAGFRDGLRWLRDRSPPQPPRLAVCHGDLWLGNIIESERSVSGVIDWSAEFFLVGDPAYDVGVTSVGLQVGGVDLPWMARRITRWQQAQIAQRFLAAYGRTRPVDMAAVRFYQCFRCVDLLSWAARRRIDPSFRTRDERDMLDVRGSTEGSEDFFRRVTGITLRMPTLP